MAADPQIEAHPRGVAETLVERARRGEAEALQRLYEVHARRVQRFAADMVGAAEASDVTQETFVRGFRRLETLTDHDKLVPWLLGIARRIAMEHLRRQRRGRRLLAEEGSSRPSLRGELVELHTPEAMALHHEATRILDGALDGLAPARRAALLLRLDHQLAYEDIAVAMGWTVGKARVEVHRARRHLRAVLDGSGGRTR